MERKIYINGWENLFIIFVKVHQHISTYERNIPIYEITKNFRWKVYLKKIFLVAFRVGILNLK